MVRMSARAFIGISSGVATAGCDRCGKETSQRQTTGGANGKCRQTPCTRGCYRQNVEFGIMGPLVVWEDGRELPVGPPRQRAVLALLLLRRGELVPTATIVDLLWGERAPPA